MDILGFDLTTTFHAIQAGFPGGGLGGGGVGGFRVLGVWGCRGLGGYGLRFRV